VRPMFVIQPGSREVREILNKAVWHCWVS
jgi:hypothetical protein